MGICLGLQHVSDLAPKFDVLSNRFVKRLRQNGSRSSVTLSRQPKTNPPHKIVVKTSPRSPPVCRLKSDSWVRFFYLEVHSLNNNQVGTLNSGSNRVDRVAFEKGSVITIDSAAPPVSLKLSELHRKCSKNFSSKMPHKQFSDFPGAGGPFWWCFSTVPFRSVVVFQQNYGAEIN